MGKIKTTIFYAMCFNIIIAILNPNIRRGSFGPYGNFSGCGRFASQWTGVMPIWAELFYWWYVKPLDLYREICRENRRHLLFTPTLRATLTGKGV